VRSDPFLKPHARYSQHSPICRISSANLRFFSHFLAIALANNTRMLSNAPVKGLDLLALMADTAAQRAVAQLLGPIRLAKCESFELAEGFVPNDVDLESWTVAADRQAIVVSVFATAPQADGGVLVAGAGRFTFTTLTSKREYRA
jgi:hypothetical protein